jgi:hypothetical protein
MTSTYITTRAVLAAILISPLVAGCADGDNEDVTDEDIIGGTATSAFPEVGMLGVSGPAELCTGFLISPTIVLTAAHCIHGGSAYAFYTGPGTLTAAPVVTPAILDALPNVTKHAVLESVIYPLAQLWVSPYRFDIAYVRLAAPIAVTPQQLGPLPGGSAVCQAVGYGWTGLQTPIGLLKKTGTETVASIDAWDIDVRVKSAVADRGDSGSPLICNGVTVGVFSWIDDYNSETALRRYARIDGYVGTWIDSIVNPPPPPPPPPPPVPFKQGDAFDYSLVSPSSQMVATMLTGFGYAASAAPKAVAINSAGLGFVSIKAGGTQADADRTALEACFIIGGRQPCASLASGNTFAVDESALPSQFTFTLAAPTALAQMPYVIDTVRTSDATTYTALNKLKAIAISLDGTVAAINSTDTIASQAEANRIVLERCEMKATMTPCTLFAEGATIVFDPTTTNWAPQIDYSRRTVQIDLPGTTAANYTAHIPAYLTGLAQGYQGSIYIAADGDGGDAWQTNAATADATALGFCNQHVTAGFRCFKYASDRTIVMGPTSLAAYATSAVHCNSMPRVDCAAHKSMGCAAGSHYTTHAGGVTLEACP